MISFYSKVTHLLDEMKVVDIAFLDFNKAFDTVPQSILLDELSSCEMSRYTLRWVMNWHLGFGIVKVTTIIVIKEILSFFIDLEGLWILAPTSPALYQISSLRFVSKFTELEKHSCTW